MGARNDCLHFAWLGVLFPQLENNFSLTGKLFFPNWGKIGVFSGFARFCTLVFLAIRIGFRNFEAVKPKNKTYEFH